MGNIISPKPVKLISGFIFKNDESFKNAESIAVEEFGSYDFKSPSFPFDLTDYYSKEFGVGLKRVFLSFQRLIDPGELAMIKRTANEIEARLSDSGGRRVNIDPGYLDLAKLVLASTKDYSHRVYLNKGIFAEVTLSFRGDSFVPNQWTYPDFRKEEYIAVFNKIRMIYRDQI